MAIPAPQHAYGAAAAAAPSIRQQLSFVLSLYQTLTNLYFLLIEQQASTSSNSTKAGIADQLKQLDEAIGGVKADNKGRGSSTATTAQSRGRLHGSSQRPDAGLTNVLEQHAERIRSLTVVQTVLKRGGRQGTVQPSIVEVTHAIGELDAIMTQLMQRARTHAVNQGRIQSLVKRIEERDVRTTATIKGLAELRDRCRSLVDVGQKERRAIEQARQHPLDYEEVLRYARTLSQTTSAPPGFAFEGAATQSGKAGAAAQVDEGQPGHVAGTSQQSRPNEQVPAHLQDKLPFPSVDAIRRGASEVRPPSWDMFKAGQLEGGLERPTTETEAQGSHATAAVDVDMQTDEREGQEARQRQRRAQQAAQQQRQKAAAAASAPVEEEEEGFGLDLS